jgi:hypothetical protein
MIEILLTRPKTHKPANLTVFTYFSAVRYRALKIMTKGAKYRLNTFNGTLEALEKGDQSENYWKLIGEYGTVINFAEELGFHNSDRVLFQFSLDLKKLNLICHNDKPNALWIEKTDLIKL